MPMKRKKETASTLIGLETASLKSDTTEGVRGFTNWRRDPAEGRGFAEWLARRQRLIHTSFATLKTPEWLLRLILTLKDFPRRHASLLPARLRASSILPIVTKTRVLRVGLTLTLGSMRLNVLANAPSKRVTIDSSPQSGPHICLCLHTISFLSAMWTSFSALEFRA